MGFGIGLRGLALGGQQRARLGPELWSSSGVVVGTGWTDNGGGSYTHASGTDTVRKNIGLANLTLYEVTFTVAGRSAGSIQPVLGGAGSGTARTGNGTFTEQITATSNALAYFQPDGTFNGTISAISIRRVL